MTEEQAQWWAAFAGLAASLIVLALLTLAVIRATAGPHAFQEAPFHWSRTIMHVLFGTSR
jgi:hypothetical protein